MKEERFSVNITVGLLLIKENKILMIRRANTGYMDGKYAFVAGHLEKGESLKEAMSREAFEEVGIEILPENLTIISSIRKAENDNYINFFLKADKFVGEPKIMEKDKCDDLEWFDINDISENIIAAEKRAIYNYQNNIYFDEYGFSN